MTQPSFMLIRSWAEPALAAEVNSSRPLAALTLLALALLASPGPAATRRLRSLSATPLNPIVDPPLVRPVWLAIAVGALGAVGWAAGGGVLGALSVVAGVGVAWTVRRAAQDGDDDTGEAELAGAWELLAVCLQVGLPVAAAVSAAAAPLAGSTGRRLRRVAGLLELGADPGTAWRGTEHVPALAAFARAAGRSAGTGAALAQVASTEGDRIRSGLTDAAEARAQRAAVLITAPLGLCFLPAFLVLGIAPVVIGLAEQALARW